MREGPIIVRGPKTRRTYVFDSPNGTPVDSADAEALLATTLFVTGE